MGKRKKSGMSRYEEVAISIANRITNREYLEGERLSGRSTLAGLHKVSPETIRRAIALLHNRGVVNAVAGTGIMVLSAQAAAKYLEEFQLKTILGDLQGEMFQLLAERQKLDARIQEVLARMLHYVSNNVATMQNVEEVLVREDSDLAGSSLAAADLRTRTSATVMALVRGGEEFYSPGPDMEIKAGDLLLIVGTTTAKEKLKGLAEEKA